MAAQLELLNYVADLLESVDIALLFALVMGDDQERGSLEQQNFIGLNNLGKIPGDSSPAAGHWESVDRQYWTRLVERFIPDGCSKTKRHSSGRDKRLRSSSRS